MREWRRAYIRAYVESRKEELATYYREYRQRNKERKDAQSRTRKARKRDAEGEHTAEEVMQMYEDQDGLCAYCERELNGEFHVEHMIPLCRGGSNDWSNLAISCPECNMRKRDKTAVEFMEAG